MSNFSIFTPSLLATTVKYKRNIEYEYRKHVSDHSKEKKSYLVLTKTKRNGIQNRKKSMNMENDIDSNRPKTRRNGQRVVKIDNKITLKK